MYTYTIVVLSLNPLSAGKSFQTLASSLVIPCSTDLIPYQQGSLKILPSIKQSCAWIEQCSIFSKLTHYQQGSPFRLMEESHVAPLAYVLIPYQQGSLKIPPSIEQSCAWIEQCSTFPSSPIISREVLSDSKRWCYYSCCKCLNPLSAGKSFQTLQIF